MSRPPLRIVALVSCYREGRLLESALASVDCLDGILIAEGPVEKNATARGSLSRFGGREAYTGVWESDADKRTWMVGRAKQRWPGPLWGLWLDGDELLLYGDQLHDWVGRVTEGETKDNPVAGWPLALVELDGSVSLCLGKLLRVDLVRRYLASSSYLELVTGDRITRGNVMFWTVRDGPLVENWRARPPLHGEPHLQHRPILREGSRTVERQHVAEERAFRAVELPPGVNGSEV